MRKNYQSINLCDSCIHKSECIAIEFYYGEDDNIVDCDSYIEIKE